MGFSKARTQAAETPAAGTSLLVMLAVAYLFTFVDVADGVLYLGDVDDRMRAFQIRDLLIDGRWFDDRMDLVQMPETYRSPWSRLVDLPYVLLIGLLAPLLGGDGAYAVAAATVPALLLAAFVALNHATMRNLAGGAITRNAALIAAMASGLAFCEFSPGRIDHHSFQLVGMAAMLTAFTHRDPRNGFWGGLAVVASVAIGLECLPFIAIVLAGVSLAGALGAEADRQRMVRTGLTIAGSAIPAALLLEGWAGTTAVECDAISAPYVSALVLGGALMAAMPGAWRSLAPGLGAGGRIASLAIAGAAALASLAFAFPECLAGPYSMIDETSRAFWFERIAQERSAYSFFENRQVGLVATLAFLTIVAVVAAPAAIADARAGKPMRAMVLAVGVAAILLTFLQVRFVRFGPAFVPLALALVLANERRPLRLDGRFAGAVATAVIGGALVLFAIIPAAERKLDGVSLMTGDECVGADFGVFASVDPGRVMAPFGLAFAIAEHAPQGFSLAALSFHRASPGIRRMALAFTGRTAEERREGLSGFDYVAVCGRQPEFATADAPLFDALARGGQWPGLSQVRPAMPGEIGLWRIDHAALR